jgi:hypothetical protein
MAGSVMIFQIMPTTNQGISSGTAATTTKKVAPRPD